jgi:hypothetical protein
VRHGDITNSQGVATLSMDRLRKMCASGPYKKVQGFLLAGNWSDEDSVRKKGVLEGGRRRRRI